MGACPRSSCTILGGVPCENSMLAAVTRARHEFDRRGLRLSAHDVVDDAHRSAIDSLLQMFRVTGPLHCDLGDGAFDVAEIVGC